MMNQAQNLPSILSVETKLQEKNDLQKARDLIKLDLEITTLKKEYRLFINHKIITSLIEEPRKHILEVHFPYKRLISSSEYPKSAKYIKVNGEFYDCITRLWYTAFLTETKIYRVFYGDTKLDPTDASIPGGTNMGPYQEHISWFETEEVTDYEKAKAKFIPEAKFCGLPLDLSDYQKDVFKWS